MSAKIRASLRRLVLLAGSWPVFGAAQSSPVTLDRFVVTATRTPINITTSGSAVEAFNASELARFQQDTLRGALGFAAGAPISAYGASGASSALFLRGSNSNQTLFLVDGIRLSDPNTDYAVFLGGAAAGAFDRIEIARGPQSTLYGSDAVGGVVSLQAQRGAGPLTQSASVEAGSFATLRGGYTAQGGDAHAAFSFAASGMHTDNDRPNNFFDGGTAVLRLDRQVNESLALGATWRGFKGNYGSPGARIGFGANDLEAEDRETNQIATVFANVTHAPSVQSRVVLGAQDRRQVSFSPAMFGTQVVKNRRGVLDWQTSITHGSHRVTAGATAEINRAQSSGFGDINRRQRLLALFAQDEFSPAENVFLTAGLRSDDHDTFGRATTGRVTGAWLVAEQRVKLRASYGTGFRAPSFLDLYGQSSYYVGNPTLKPEKARGWDAGVDFFLPKDRGVLAVTWFDTRLTGLITYDFAVFPSTVRNVDDARTRGLEVSAKVSLVAGTELRLNYTFLEAENLTLHNRLLRRPRHSGTFEAVRELGARFTVGAGVTFAAQREDVDAASYARIDAEDYCVARVHGSWRVNDRLTLTARIENLLDEKYEQVHGYPQPSFAGYAGAQWRF